MKAKKDRLPIILYIILFFGIQIMGVVLQNILVSQNDTIDSDEFLSLLTVLSYFGTFLAIVIFYFDKIIKDIKRLTKKNILVIVISAIVLIVANNILTNILLSFNVEMANQDAITDAINYYKPLMVLSIAFFAPVVEEMVFRYSISTLIKNKIAFIIVSSLIFGILHGIGIVTILYTLMGIILAICYQKTDHNIVSSTIVHILNNTLGVLMMLIIF